MMDVEQVLIFGSVLILIFLCLVYVTTDHEE